MEEFSAGGIVYRLEAGKPVVLVSQHSGHHGWVFPKGHVGDTDPTETKEQAAIREVQEETGIIGNILEALPLVNFWYVWEKQKRHKTVQYYLMDYKKGDIKDHGWEMEHVEWLPIDQVEKRLTYDADKKVWKSAQEKIIDRISGKM